MSDELTMLERETRKAFRAFYGDDDPIVFSDLTPEQRKRFESVAKKFQSPLELDEIQRFRAELDSLHENVQGILVDIVSGEDTKRLGLAIGVQNAAEAFDILARALEPIRELQERYARR